MSRLTSGRLGITRGVCARWSRRSERGAIAVLVTIVMSGGVLLGMGALTVDVGQIWAEREQLQSGANAAALAVAKGCALDPSTCASQATKAATYANTNAKDGATTVSTICGTGQGMTACSAEPTGLSGCMGTVPSGVTYVEVRTATLETDGSTLLPPTFAKELAGNSAYQGTHVAACSRAGWGTANSATGIAVTISACEWNNMTSGGTVWQSPPPAVATADGVIYLHSTTGATTCPAGPSGWDAPGGFGWLDDAGNCTASVTSAGTVSGNTGTSASGTCQTVLSNARTNVTVLAMPIYDGIQGTGTNSTYHIVGVSEFVVTGYKLPSLSAPSTVTGKDYCKGSDKCIYGYFTTGIIPVGSSIGGSTNYGATAVSTIG